MHEVVQPVVAVPYFMEDNVRFSHVAVDVVQGKDMLFHIIYLATGNFCQMNGLNQHSSAPRFWSQPKLSLFEARNKNELESMNYASVLTYLTSCRRKARSVSCNPTRGYCYDPESIVLRGEKKKQSSQKRL